MADLVERLMRAVDEVERRRAEWDKVIAALQLLPPGPWEVWTSNSYRRITGPDGRDGGVLCAQVASDGWPDLSMNEEQLRALCDVVNGLRALFPKEAGDE